MTSILTEARKNYATLCEEKKKIQADNIFKRWMEMKNVSGELTILSGDQNDNFGFIVGALLEFNPSSDLSGSDDATFLKGFYQWWHEIDSFNAEVKVLLSIYEEINERQALFTLATAELSPCYMYMQYRAENSDHEKYLEFLKRCEAMGLEFNSLAREFLFTAPRIERTATPLCCVDPTFCFWDREGIPGVKARRETLEKGCTDKKAIEANILQALNVHRLTFVETVKRLQQEGKL